VDSLVLRLARKAVRTYRMRTDPVRWARSVGIQVGERCRLIDITDRTFGSEPELIHIGSHVTITSDVRFVTHDGGVWVFRDQYPDIDVIAPIRVGDNVFLGIGAILLPGVSIGNNCVIGAGSVVTRDIPEGVVAVGNPARPIKKVSEYLASSLAKSVNTKQLKGADRERALRGLTRLP
jgi:acetyltransferase-like isoleucine patch superfamily enzyme